jgi:hypothetical protein
VTTVTGSRDAVLRTSWIAQAHASTSVLQRIVRRLG